MTEVRDQYSTKGYDESLPSKAPFMWIEREEAVEDEELGRLVVLAFGAYNALGLIGTEKGGVALVHDNPNFVIATKDFPWNSAARQKEVEEVIEKVRQVVAVKGSPTRINEIKNFLIGRSYLSRIA